MRVTEGSINYNNASENDSKEEFFDCEVDSHYAYFNNDIYYDCQEASDNFITPLTDDIKNSIFHLANVITAYEAERFSISALYRAGLDIPVSVVLAARTFYRAWRRQESLGTLFISELPLFICVILPYCGQLTNLAQNIRNLFEPLGISHLDFLSAPSEKDDSLYLGLGILALVCQFYFTGHTRPAPRRIGLKAPVILTRLFTRICACWQLLCAATDHAGQSSATDTYGRLRLSPAEKTEQSLQRGRARGWARNSHSQRMTEQAAEHYYGIITSSVNASRPPRRVVINDGITSRPSHPPRRAFPSSLLPPIRGIFDGLTQAMNRLFPLLPAVGAAPADIASGPSPGAAPYATIITRNNFPSLNQTSLCSQFNRLLMHTYPSITATVAHRVTQAIGQRFGMTINAGQVHLRRFNHSLQGSVQFHPGTPTHAITLCDFVLLKLFSQEFEDLELPDAHYGLFQDGLSASTADQGAPLPLKPSDLVRLALELDLPAAQRHELDRYWLNSYAQHAFANLIRMVAQLIAAEGYLNRQDTALYLHVLGFSDRRFQAARLSLFDINGVSASDLFVIDAPEQRRVCLYLPRARVPFKRFEDWAAMRRWIIEQSREANAREEILDHFSLKERLDEDSLFGKWGVDREMERLTDNPDDICRQQQPQTEPLYELLTRRQRLRTLEDAGFMAQLPRLMKTQSGGTLIDRLKNLYVPPAIPAISPSPVGNDGRHPAVGALHVLAATAAEILTIDDTGAIRFSGPERIDLSAYQRIIDQEWQTWMNTPAATPGEARIVSQLAIRPQRYEREMRFQPDGRLNSHLHIQPPGAGEEPLDKLPAINLFNCLLPLRFNSHLKAYEVYDIHNTAKPGYPVIIDNRFCWQFGRLTYTQLHGSQNITLADYSFVSVRLYESLMEKMSEYCSAVTDFTPVNSQGIGQDLNGTHYLTLKNHHIKINQTLTENIYLLSGNHNNSLKIKFDPHKKKFISIPNGGNWRARHYADRHISPAMRQNATDHRLSYRQGFRARDDDNARLALAAEKALLSNRLKRVAYYGLTDPTLQQHPRHAEAAARLRRIFATCSDILKQLNDTLAVQREQDLFLIALQLQEAGANHQRRARTLFRENLEKTRALLERHIEDKFARVWLSKFDQADIVAMGLKHDPLHRLWLNVRGMQPKHANGRYQVDYCRYGCNEIKASEHIALVKQSTESSRDGAGTPFITPVHQEEFPRLIQRLWAGDMTDEEINILLSLPDAAAKEHAALMSGKELARNVFRTNAVARTKMLLSDGDYFSHLLLHLHARLYRDHDCGHHYRDPGLRTTLFMLAFQALR